MVTTDIRVHVVGHENMVCLYVDMSYMYILCACPTCRYYNVHVPYFWRYYNVYAPYFWSYYICIKVQCVHSRGNHLYAGTCMGEKIFSFWSTYWPLQHTCLTLTYSMHRRDGKHSLNLNHSEKNEWKLNQPISASFEPSCPLACNCVQF